MGAWLGNIFRLGVKELRSLRADPVLLFLIVYAFTFAIYEVATGVGFEVADASVAIVDEDRSELSRRIANAILKPYFKPPVEIQANEIDSAMDSGRFVFVIEVPPEFEQDLIAGRRPSLQIDVDATAMAQAGNGAVYLQNIVAQEVLAYAGRSEQGGTPPVNLVIRSKFNPNLQSRWFTSIMEIINNITMMAVILTGGALIREREHGTVEHLLVMPVTPAEIMLAKIWANGLAILAAAIFSLWFVAHQLLQVPIAGSIALFIAGAVLYLLSVTSLGILLATFTGTMGQFGLLVMPVLIVLQLLSGSTTPMESMPLALQELMRMTPTTQFVGFAQAVLYRGAGLETVWPGLAALAATTVVFFGISLMRFRATLASFQS